MEEATFLGMTISQLSLAGLGLTILAILIAMFAVMVSQANATRSEVTAHRAETNTRIESLRADMTARIESLRAETRADFRALEARFDSLSAEVIGMKIDLAYIKGRVGIAEEAPADASANAE